jgi:hypothetical protein
MLLPKKLPSRSIQKERARLLGGHFSSDILEGERLEAGEFLARPASTVLPHRVQAQALTFV